MIPEYLDKRLIHSIAVHTLASHDNTHVALHIPSPILPVCSLLTLSFYPLPLCILPFCVTRN